MTIDPGDPAWFPTGIDASRQEASFRRTSRHALSEAPFLDSRFVAPPPEVRVPLAVLAQRFGAAAGRPPPTIFHTAFCCSTLLASALDRPGRVLALKEPDVLMQLANLRRVDPVHASDDARFAALGALVFAMLGRRFAPAEQVLVKPTNAANNLLPLAATLGGQVLLLRTELPDFLVSVIKKGEAGRWFVRHLFNIFRLDRPDIDGWPDRERMLLTDLQVAALVWQVQMDRYVDVLRDYASTGRVRTLPAAAILDRPAAALAAVDRFLGLGLGQAAIDEVLTGPVFSRHSKFRELDYDSTLRATERAAIAAVHEDVIETTLRWSERLRGPGPPPDLARFDLETAESSG
jgi:hypothetical protein